MVSKLVISFQEWYWTNFFPIEAQFLQWNEQHEQINHMAQVLHSPDELRAFQDELVSRESAGDWCFLAYFET